MSDYPPPVAGLLRLGEEQLTEPWIDYPARGIGREHVPDLIRMVRDPALHEGDPEGSEVWAPLHAARALGQLRAAEATGSLYQAMVEDLERDGDYVREEMPAVFAMIGPPTLPVLSAALRDPTADLYARWAVADMIGAVAERHPEVRAECVGLLVAQLERSAENDPELNAGIISCLVDLKEVDAAPLIERAFAAGEVEEMVMGGWQDVRYELGLGPRPARRTRPFFPDQPPARTPKSRAQERARNRKRQAKKSKKRNRKK